MVNMRIVAIAKLLNDYTKNVLEDAKTELRDKTKASNNEYANIQYKDYSQFAYSEEDQKEIDEFIKAKGFEKIKATKENHTIVIQPTEKAKKEYDKIVSLLMFTGNEAITKVASKITR